MNPQSVTILSTLYAMSIDIATNYPPSQYTKIFESFARSMAKIAKLEGLEEEVLVQATKMTALKKTLTDHIIANPTEETLRFIYPDISQEEMDKKIEALKSYNAKNGGEVQ